MRILDFGKRGGGVLHAKYFVVDGEEAFVGSQNFDWRALAHIQEMGVRVTLARARRRAARHPRHRLGARRRRRGRRARRRASARPAGEVRTRTGEQRHARREPEGLAPRRIVVGAAEARRACSTARREAIDVQVLTYKTKERDGSPFPTLDDALRRAAARGVRVRLLVSDWASKPGSDSRRVLDELAKVPNVEVRVITIPRWSGGDIPFARVAHAKYMVVDAAQARLGRHEQLGGRLLHQEPQRRRHRRRRGRLPAAARLDAHLRGRLERRVRQAAAAEDTPTLPRTHRIEASMSEALPRRRCW